MEHNCALQVKVIEHPRARHLGDIYLFLLQRKPIKREDAPQEQQAKPKEPKKE
jgi:hypothetical protein